MVAAQRDAIERERKAEKRNRRIKYAAIIVSIVLLMCIGLLAYRAVAGLIGSVNGQTTAVVAPTPHLVVRPTQIIAPTSTRTHEDQVVAVVRQFNQDQTYAFRHWDANRLAETATGDWLEFQYNYLDEDLRQRNLYEVQEQLRFEVVRVDMSGDEATVWTHETWRTQNFPFAYFLKH